MSSNPQRRSASDHGSRYVTAWACHVAGASFLQFRGLAGDLTEKIRQAFQSLGTPLDNRMSMPSHRQIDVAVLRGIRSFSLGSLFWRLRLADPILPYRFQTDLERIEQVYMRETEAERAGDPGELWTGIRGIGPWNVVAPTTYRLNVNMVLESDSGQEQHFQVDFDVEYAP